MYFCSQSEPQIFYLRPCAFPRKRSLPFLQTMPRPSIRNRGALFFEVSHLPPHKLVMAMPAAGNSPPPADRLAGTERADRPKQTRKTETSKRPPGAQDPVKGQKKAPRTRCSGRFAFLLMIAALTPRQFAFFLIIAALTPRQRGGIRNRRPRRFPRHRRRPHRPQSRRGRPPYIQSHRRRERSPFLRPPRIRRRILRHRNHR